MKPIEQVDKAKLKESCKLLNECGLLEKNIKIVAVKGDDLIATFTEAVESIAQSGRAADLPPAVTLFYNDLYEDETGKDDKVADKKEEKKKEKKEKKEKSTTPRPPSNIARMKTLIQGDASDDEIWKLFWPTYKEKGQTEEFCQKRIRIYKDIARKELGLPKEEKPE